MKNKFLLICGVFGVGKTTIIKKIISLDGRFSYISPFVTRPLRPGETDKISISKKKFLEMKNHQEFVITNEFFGIKYGTPKKLINDSFNDGRFPILDWQAKDLKKIVSLYGDKLFVVYLLPPSLDSLFGRIKKDSRNNQEERIQESRNELDGLDSLDFSKFVNLFIVNEDSLENKVALDIIDNFFNFSNNSI